MEWAGGSWEPPGSVVSPWCCPALPCSPIGPGWGPGKAAPREAMYCRIPASFPTLSQLLLTEPKPPQGCCCRSLPFSLKAVCALRRCLQHPHRAQLLFLTAFIPEQRGLWQNSRYWVLGMEGEERRIHAEPPPLLTPRDPMQNCCPMLKWWQRSH